MFGFKSKEEQPTFNVFDWGTLTLEKCEEGAHWFGDVNWPISKTSFELLIQVEDEAKPTQKHLTLLAKFEDDWPLLKNKIYDFLVTHFSSTDWPKSKDELLGMYLLTMVELKRDRLDWWVVLESAFDVPTIFNFMIRLTVRNNEIVWSNLE